MGSKGIRENVSWFVGGRGSILGIYLGHNILLSLLESIPAATVQPLLYLYPFLLVHLHLFLHVKTKKQQQKM